MSGVIPQGLDRRSDVRLGTQIGSDLITAECLLPGCGWRMNFSWGAMRLTAVNEVCEAHPCKSELINELRIIAIMTPNEGMEYLRWLLAKHDQQARPGRRDGSMTRWTS